MKQSWSCPMLFDFNYHLFYVFLIHISNIKRPHGYHPKYVCSINYISQNLLNTPHPKQWYIPLEIYRIVFVFSRESVTKRLNRVCYNKSSRKKFELELWKLIFMWPVFFSLCQTIICIYVRQKTYYILGFQTSPGMTNINRQGMNQSWSCPLFFDFICRFSWTIH